MGPDRPGPGRGKSDRVGWERSGWGPAESARAWWGPAESGRAERGLAESGRPAVAPPPVTALHPGGPAAQSNTFAPT